MKKFTIIISTMYAIVSLGASSQTASAPPGTDNIAAGYGAGFKAGGENEDVICIGTDAGMYSTNNHQCIFIGKEAGKKIKNQQGYIDIGGKIIVTEGSMTINVPTLTMGSGASFNCDSLIVDGTDNSATIGGILINKMEDKTGPVVQVSSGNLNVLSKIDCTNEITVRDSSFYYKNENTDWTLQVKGNGSPVKGSDPSKVTTLREELEAKVSGCSLVYSNGTMSVYKDGAKIGILTFTPVQ